ncbi:hypothetical protein ACFX2A_046372 [Malus domestica]
MNRFIRRRQIGVRNEDVPELGHLLRVRRAVSHTFPISIEFDRLQLLFRPSNRLLLPEKLFFTYLDINHFYGDHCAFLPIDDLTVFLNSHASQPSATTTTNLITSISTSHDDCIALPLTRQLLYADAVTYAPQQEKIVMEKRLPKLKAAILSAQKCLEDCNYVRGLLDEWWEQPTATVVDWVCVDGLNVAARHNHVKRLLEFYDQGHL